MKLHCLKGKKGILQKNDPAKNSLYPERAEDRQLQWDIYFNYTIYKKHVLS